MTVEYVNVMEKTIGLLKEAGALKDFRRDMMVMAEMTSREMLSASDDNYLHALRGQMRFCFELADRAAQALDAEEAEAKASAAERIPESLR